MFNKFATEFSQIVWRQSAIQYLEPLIQLFWPSFMAGFFRAKVLKLTPEAGCLRLRLKVSRRFPLFVPGQHVRIRLLLAGRFVERTFSLCSDVADLADHEIELAIKPQVGGLVTSQLPELLKPGTRLHLSAPQGDFYHEAHRPALMIAAGSGITPIFSMLQSARRLLKPVTLIYCYRGPQAPLFSKELDHLIRQSPLLTLALHDSQRGRLDLADWLRQQPQPADALVYLCGPAPAMQQWREQLMNAEITAGQLRQEQFGLQALAQSNSQVVVLNQGRQTILSGQGILLQRAEQSGLSVPYGCRRGVCMQCLCRKISGVVRYVDSGMVSASGTEYIQLCNTEAVTPVELTLDSETPT